MSEYSDPPDGSCDICGAIDVWDCDCGEEEEDPQNIELDYNRYYVVEVELFRGNPRHRAIIRPYVIAGKNTEVEFLNYEERLRCRVGHLHFFRVIREIKEMRKCPSTP